MTIVNGRGGFKHKSLPHEGDRVLTHIQTVTTALEAGSP